MNTPRPGRELLNASIQCVWTGLERRSTLGTRSSSLGSKTSNRIEHTTPSLPALSGGGGSQTTSETWALQSCRQTEFTLQQLQHKSPTTNNNPVFLNELWTLSGASPDTTPLTPHSLPEFITHSTVLWQQTNAQDTSPYHRHLRNTLPSWPHGTNSAIKELPSQRTTTWCSSRATPCARSRASTTPQKGR